MGNNAQRATPGSMPGDTSSSASGARSRVSGVSTAPVRTPPSGVRQAPPPLPTMRPQLDSEEMTRVGEPNPMLLAIARGAPARRPRHVTWFMIGTALGALTVWACTSDVRADVYAARMWTANVLRSLRAPTPAEDDAPKSDAPPATEITEGTVPAPAPAAAGASPEIPTVDVTELPRTPDPAAPPSGPAPGLVNAPGPR